jgi:Leucine-rich repeat (LRR) protein
MNKITSLEGIKFPSKLTDLQLQSNKITSLHGVEFPPGLISLDLTNNKITSLHGVEFPPGLISLDLTNNKITSFAGMRFPLSLFSLKLAGNPIDLKTVSELKNPSPFVIREIVAAFPETGPYFQHIEEETVNRLFEIVRDLYKKKGGKKKTVRRKRIRTVYE